MIVVAWLATRPPHALSALLMNCQQKTLPTGIGSKLARALWKGAISYGLMHIPVELISASLEHELDLSMLDRRDFAPIDDKRDNKRTGKEWRA